MNLTDHTCSSCPSNCASCTDSSTCLYCISNNTLVKGTCVPTDVTIGCPQWCSICPNSTCIQCQDYSFLSSSNDCLACPQNCLSCSNSSVCLQCDQYSILNNGSCNQVLFQSLYPPMVSAPNCPANCNQCSNPTTCTVCVTRYALDSNGGDCVKCPLNCHDCDVQSTCRICLPGFFVDGNGTCTACAANCESCPSTESCQLSCELRGLLRRQHLHSVRNGILRDEWLLSEDCVR